ncbi:MAG: helix-turn-helix domain-containing protein [Candidatus Desulfofervidus auxilii]|nr:helix-turn-helix domain-containing protein [Candidatus Desulfofervidus auxilii]
MKTLADRIKFLYKQSGLTQDKFAKLLGIHKHTLSLYMNGNRSPRADTLHKIITQLNVNPNWLLMGEGIPFETPKTQSQTQYFSEEYVMIPLLDTEIAADVADIWPSEKIIDYCPFKRIWLCKEYGCNEEKLKRFVILRCRGDSMSPTINNGEFMIVDTNLECRIEIIDDGIYIVRREDGSISVKRVLLKESDTLFCVSDNKAYKPFTIKIQAGKTIQYYVLGRVVWTWHKLR